MAERATVFQTVQIGVETDAGTPVAANRRLGSLSISPAVQSESDPFRPMGVKWPTVVVQNREWVEANLEGSPTFDEIVYPLASVLTGAVVATPDGATAARLWTFDPSSDEADEPETFTVEQGSSERAHRFSHGIVSALNLNFGRDTIDMGGTMLGQLLVDGVTLTTSPVSAPLVPITPKSVDVYLDATADDLGDTKLLRNFQANVEIGERYNPVWVLDSDHESFAVTVEGEPSGQVTLRVAADAQGMGMLPLLRSGDTRFLRIEATGPEIESDQEYRLTLDLALKVTGVSEFSDEEGVYAIEWTFTFTHDAEWGRAVKAEVVNTLTEL